MQRTIVSRGLGLLSAAIIAAAALTPVTAQAQATRVTGRVVSTELRPLATARVQVQGTSVVTVTNADGNYTIMAPSPTATLEFTMLGMRTLVEPIAGRTVINVAMEAQAIALDAIVAVGYGQQTRATVSGSVSSVSSSDISRSSSTTTTDMLVGKIAGINTRMMTGGNATYAGREATDGRPGAATSMQIRNMGEPLYVIDGIPSDARAFNQLNAQDIQDVSVLKDASAAIYGFLAANGAVIVTTKRGSSARTPEVSVQGYYGWQNLPRSRSSFGYANTALQFMYSIVESQQNTGQTKTITPEILENYRIGGPGYESFESWNYVMNNNNAPQGYLTGSISGGSDNSSYYLSLGYTSQDYTTKDNNFSRANLQANLRSEPLRGVTVGTELRGRTQLDAVVALTEESDPVKLFFKSIQSMWPHQDPYANGNREFVNGNVRNILRSPGIFTRDISGTQDQIRQNVSANFWAEINLPFGFKTKATFSRTFDTEKFDIHRYQYNGYCYDKAADAYNTCYTSQSMIREARRVENQTKFFNVQASKSLNVGGHSASGLVAFERNGGEGTGTLLRSVPATNYNFLINFSELNNGSLDWNINRRMSYIGRFNYDFRQKYLIEFLGRYDGSYRYASDKRWGFFPGISAGWRVTEEPFLRDKISFLDDMKLRVSWGQTGREQGIADWGYLGGATYGSGGAVLTDQFVRGVAPRGLPVTNLSWVTATSKNAGLDLTMFNSRVSAQFDAFRRDLTGLPASRYDVTLPNEVGYTLPNENLESETTVGIEGAISYNDRVGAFTYSVGTNATLARRKILDRYKQRFGNSWLWYTNANSQGRWADVNFLYHMAGQFKSVEEILNYPVDIDGQGNRTLLPGDYYYTDTNGDNIINTMDQRPAGYNATSTPLVNFGVNGNFSYLGMTLNYDLAGATMYSYAPATDLTVPYTSDHNGGAFIWSRWRRADPFNDQSEWIPGKFPPSRKGATNHSSSRASDATRLNITYLRVRRLELGYVLPVPVVSRFGLSNLRVYGSTENPWVFDAAAKKWASDPESTESNGQLYPSLTVTNIGFSMNFGGAMRPTPPVVPVPPAD